MTLSAFTDLDEKMMRPFLKEQTILLFVNN